MSEQFGGTLLNGREQVSTGGSRGVELDQYPAELINGVDPNGASAFDIEVTLPPDYLTKSLWLDPDPMTRSTPVAAGRTWSPGSGPARCGTASSVRAVKSSRGRPSG